MACKEAKTHITFNLKMACKEAKRHSATSNNHNQAWKKQKMIIENSSEGDDSESGGNPVKQAKDLSHVHILAVNQTYAQRFEYNKRRQELQRLEEKYGDTVTLNTKDEGQGRFDKDGNGVSIESSTDSEDEDEDDEGILASKELDTQIQATLEAIRGKDPRVYDGKAKFYADFDDEGDETITAIKQHTKPVYLSDYHREYLLAGDAGAEIEDEKLPTYIQQQDDLRKTIIKEVHSATDRTLISSANEESANDGYKNEDDAFLVRKLPEKRADAFGTRAKGKVIRLDPQSAEKDPEAFLTNFMSARAWIAPAGSKMQPFESDDEEEERRAEAFEEAYNLRFEDTKGSNEKLLSHARDTAARYSVRKEQSNSRKKVREIERTKREAERRKREEEKARLRKLKIVEVEDKLRKIKDAAGFKDSVLQAQDWARFIDESWNNDRWEEEMQRRFGDEYYADRDTEGRDDGKTDKKPSVKKPKWLDDIDILDIIPEFKEDVEIRKAHSVLRDDDSDQEIPLSAQADAFVDESIAGSWPSDTKILRKDARKERRRIEEIVDQRLHVDDAVAGLSNKCIEHFRYRATSPLSYGLTANDILMATDSQLNRYAGLKKMATFRNKEKKKRDKKHLGKKARLREWRKETFGNPNGPQQTLAEAFGTHTFEEPIRTYHRKDFSREEGKRSRS